jgi:hypothetical protein
MMHNAKAHMTAHVLLQAQTTFQVEQRMRKHFLFMLAPSAQAHITSVRHGNGTWCSRHGSVHFLILRPFCGILRPYCAILRSFCAKFLRLKHVKQCESWLQTTILSDIATLFSTPQSLSQLRVLKWFKHDSHEDLGTRMCA